VMVETAAEMHSVVMAHAGASDIVIAVAAVADYAPARAEEHKLKKGPRELMLTLHQTPDILAGVSALPASPFTVGFAAETESLEANARKKRMAKCIDMVAANRVGRRGTGFDADDNELQLIWEGGSRHLPRTSKQHLARQLVEIIAERYRLRNRANATTGDHAEDSA
jgi:phosphopantothenoylcysteine decarboxylase/phosphopantothenate--cysteine ligase